MRTETFQAIRREIARDPLTERQAAALLKIRDKERQIDAARQICENSLNESETIDFIAGLLDKDVEPTVKMNRIKDIKVLRNTLNTAVGLLRRSGIDVEYSESAADDGQEFVILVHN